jgi:hypothetical protein
LLPLCCKGYLRRMSGSLQSAGIVAEYWELVSDTTSLDMVSSC